MIHLVAAPISNVFGRILHAALDIILLDLAHTVAETRRCVRLGGPQITCRSLDILLQLLQVFQVLIQVGCNRVGLLPVQAAAALAESGLDGLVPARPGPRGGHKLTGQILAWAEQQLAGDPALRPAGLAGPIAEEFGVRVQPRSIERALARRREHSKSR